MELRNHLEFIANRSSDDDERIARIKDLLVDADAYTTEQRHQIGHVLAEIIEERDEDVVLRQHASNDIGYYLNIPSPGLRERFDDLKEDEDLRYNLHFSFKSDFPIEALRPTKPEQIAAGQPATRLESK